MSVPLTSRGKAKLKIKPSKNGISNKSDTRTTNDNNKKPDVPISTNTHRDSNAEKSLSNDTQERVAGEPYVHECRDFAGVTVIIRTLYNPKALGNSDGSGKGGLHGSRRRSEFQQSQSNAQDKLEYGDRNDHLGSNPSNATTKAENSHETGGNDH